MTVPRSAVFVLTVAALAILTIVLASAGLHVPVWITGTLIGFALGRLAARWVR